MTPTKLTAACGASIIRAKASGSTHAVAAQAGGIPLRTLRMWLRKGEAGIEPYATFAKAFHRSLNAARRKAIAAATRQMNRVLDAA
jgi:hypothetical protein